MRRTLLLSCVMAVLGVGVAHGKECKGINFPEQAQVEGEEVSTLFSYEKSAIVAPLEFEGRLLGVLYLGRAPASSFAQEDFDT
ncbi:MAG: hypothetical protein Q8P98_15715, partial [Candidatus Rokubacteria bacterium]|nr:hypothetical protein [Candidatus Rokubacteria bacterium]